MPISDISSVIPAAGARHQQQDLVNRPHIFVDEREDSQNTPSFSQEFEDNLEDTDFDGYDALGHKTPLGIGLGLINVIDELVDDTFEIEAARGSKTSSA